MRKFKLILDESGKFEKDEDKYIIIGGLLFEEKDEKAIEEKLRPIHDNICKTLGVEELHGCKNKVLLKYLCCPLGTIKELHKIVFIIDKQEAYIFDTYSDKSFKYNKAIEHIIRKLLSKGLISLTDELYIKIDEINASEAGRKNLSTYLPKEFKFVKEVVEASSKDVICLQLADVIVNSFPLKICPNKLPNEVDLLNPCVLYFLASTEQEFPIINK